MKTFCGSVRFDGGYRSADGFALFLAVLLLSAGCGQKSEQPASVPQQTNASLSNVNSAAPAEPDLQALDRAMRRWLVANRRPPRNFDDFAATAGVPIPPPPAGKKYILTQNMHIQLVDVK